MLGEQIEAVGEEEGFRAEFDKVASAMLLDAAVVHGSMVGVVS